MSKFLRHPAVFAILLLFSNWAQGLEPEKTFNQYVLDAWSIEQGLPQITVYTMSQDKQGYLWVGTQAGLARFDGVEFKTYTTENTAELHGEYIQHLLSDSKGRLWIGSYKGLSLYENRRFKRIFTDNEQSDQQLNVRKITEDMYGQIWLATDSGLFQLQEQTLKAYRDLSHPIKSVLGANNRLFVGGIGKLWVLYENQLHEVLLPPVYQESNVNHLLWADSSLWIGTDNGLLRYSVETDTIAVLQSESQLARQPIDAIGLDSDQNIWIGTLVGLFRIRDGRVIEHIKNDNPHNFQNVISFFEDHEKNLWLGSYRDGIARLWNGRTRRYSVNEGLDEALVWSVLPTRDGESLWTGTNRGLYRLSGGKYERIIAPDQLPHPTVYTMLAEPDQLWLGTRKGLARYRDGQVEIPPHSEQLSALQISSIYRDRSDNLWLGTSSGLYRHDENSLQAISTSDNRAIFIRPITQLTDGRVLVGSQKGLYQLIGDELVPVGLDSGLNQELDVSGIFQLDESIIAISTLSQGIFFFYQDHWHQFSEANGMPVNQSFTINADNQGHLWVSGFKGLYQTPVSQMIDVINGKRDQVKAYMILSESGGIIGSQKSFCCNGAGNAKGFFQKDTLWYPTRDGVVALDTKNIKLNPVLPNVVIERVKFNDSWQTMYGQERLSLAADERDVEFGFTALSFRDPKSVQFQFRLVGYQDEWRTLDEKARRQVNYTNLSPGNYSFQVKASNNAGFWNSKIADVNFSIAPFYYESNWFYGLIVLLTMLLVTGWHKLRTRSLQMKKVELESKIKQHTAQLEVSNQRLHDAVQALKQTSQTDQLSGLRNRRYLADQLPSDLAHFDREYQNKMTGEKMIFAIVDIDHFKRVNDKYGHKAGDNVIKKFSQLIRDHIREGDYAVRWGGEEFIIVFRAMQPDTTPLIIERLREKIASQAFHVGTDKTIQVTCSIGFAEYPFFDDDSHRLNWEHLIEIADIALYMVKENGRNGWAAIKPTETTPRSDELLFIIKDDLHGEIAANRLKLDSSFSLATLPTTPYLS